MEKKSKKGIILLIIFIIVIAGIIFGYCIKNKKNNLFNDSENLYNEEEIVSVEEEKIKIFNGDDRPIAVMIDNNVNAQPHSALNRAYMVYEIIVEGGETRLMALFKGIDTEKEDVVVGPVRSARHYFIDYALESDAVYAHLGQSPEAGNYIKSFAITDINGQIYDTGKSRTSTSLYWRVSHKSSPHNAYTSLGSLKKICEKNDDRLTSDKKSVLNYTTDDINFDDNENAIDAYEITIPYTSTHKVKYVYDEESKRYTRYSKGKKMTDEETGDDVTTKNIIISFIKNVTLNDGEDKGRQDLDNFVTAKGYYITNGKAISILCKKEYVGGQTLYTDLDGNEIEVNDDNTWINICPIDSEVVIEGQIEQNNN